LKTIFLIIFSFFAISYSYCNWISLGLNHLQSNHLTVFNDTVYVSTNNGIYKKSAFDSDNVWIPCGKQGSNVIQALVIDHSTYIVVSQVSNISRTQIFKTINYGQSFFLLTSDTSDEFHYPYLNHFANSSNNTDTLLFLFHKLYTIDGGVTWDTLYNPTNHLDKFIALNPSNPNQIIIGGELGFFNAYIQISNDFGKNWNMSTMSSYFSGDNSVHDVVIDGNSWYVVGESLISKSNDSGNSWTELLNHSASSSQYCMYYYDIEFSPSNKDVLYVSGSSHSGSKLISLLYSIDTGISWEYETYSTNILDQNIRCLEVISHGNKDLIFFAGKGVYLFEKSLLEIENEKKAVPVLLYPTIAINSINLKLHRSNQSPLIITIYNLYGIPVKKINIIDFSKEHKISINSLTSGAYIVQIQSDIYKSTLQFIKL
jgi:hypothetical protein